MGDVAWLLVGLLLGSAATVIVGLLGSALVAGGRADSLVPPPWLEDGVRQPCYVCGWPSTSTFGAGKGEFYFQLSACGEHQDAVRHYVQQRLLEMQEERDGS